MFRRIVTKRVKLFDKEIGRRLYVVKCNDSVKCNHNNVMADTINNQMQEIKNLKTDIMDLQSRLVTLTNDVNKCNSRIETNAEDIFIMFVMGATLFGFAFTMRR